MEGIHETLFSCIDCGISVIVGECNEKQKSKKSKTTILCPSCFQTRKYELTNSLNHKKEQLKEYYTLLEKQKNTLEEDYEIKKLEKDYEKTIKEEENYEDQYQFVLRSNENLKKRMQEIRSIEKEFNKLVISYYHDLHDFKHKSDQYQEESKSKDDELQTMKDYLCEINSVNIFNEFFHIWFEGYFTTINKFKIGALQTRKTKWQEINCGLGYCTQLLLCLAKEFNVEIKRYQLIPKGSKSIIKNLQDNSIYPFHYSKKMKKKIFNKCLIAFLDCTKQIADSQIKKEKLQGKELSLPYEMGNTFLQNKHNDKFSIKYDSSREHEWTKAFKLLLTNIKTLVVHVSRLKNKKINNL